MELERLGLISGVFVLFCLLFTIPFIIQTEPDRARAQPMAVESADAGRTQDTGGSFPATPVLTVLLLSLVSTVLSWRVVSDLRSGSATNLSGDEGERILEALADDTRRSILQALENEQLAASEIAEKLDMSIQRVQYNIDKLVDAGLVKSDAYKYGERGQEMDLYELEQKQFVIGTE